MNGTWDNDRGRLRRLKLLGWSTRFAQAIAERRTIAFLLRRGR